MTSKAEQPVGKVFDGLPLPAPEIEGLTSRRLSDREVQIVRSLVKIFASGFADKTMADLADLTGSSLRSLYRLAPSRGDLVLLVVNQSLRTMSHESRTAAKSAATALEGVALYVHRTAMSMAKLSPDHARDLVSIPAVSVLARRYARDRVESLEALFLLAIDQGEMDASQNAKTFAFAAHGFVGCFTGERSQTQKVMVNNVDRSLGALLTGLVLGGQSGAGVWTSAADS